MKILKRLLFLAGFLVVLGVVAIIAAGILIPSERSFTNEIEIKAPAENVWQVANDRSKYTEWQTNLTRVEVIDEKNWIEYPKDSPEPLRFTLVKDNSPSDMEIRYSMGDAFDGYWIGEVTPTASGVRLKTVDGYVAKGWLTNVLIFMFFDMGRFAKDWNRKLKDRVEELNR